LSTRNNFPKTIDVFVTVSGLLPTKYLLFRCQPVYVCVFPSFHRLHRDAKEHRAAKKIRT